jgi:hypothetical protein
VVGSVRPLKEPKLHEKQQAIGKVMLFTVNDELQ